MKPLDVQSEDRGAYVLVQADGYINNLGGEKLAEICYRWLKDGRTQLVLDLAHVPLINSIGVSILIEVVEAVLEKGGRLAFMNLNSTVERTFKIMGLLQYTGVFRDMAEADRSMQAAT